MRRLDTDEGSFFSEADDFTHTRVAIIGSDVRKKLFSGQNALGESIRLDGISYQVIGILRHQVQTGDDNTNGHFYAPFRPLSDLAKPKSLNSRAVESGG